MLATLNGRMCKPISVYVSPTRLRSAKRNYAEVPRQSPKTKSDLFSSPSYPRQPRRRPRPDRRDCSGTGLRRLRRLHHDRLQLRERELHRERLIIRVLREGDILREKILILRILVLLSNNKRLT